MNKIIMTLAAVMTMGLAACAQDKGERKTESENKPLVVYFSATGTTARAARMIADATGGVPCEIVPQQAYTSKDLDWNDSQSRSSVEMNPNRSLGNVYFCGIVCNSLIFNTLQNQFLMTAIRKLQS